MSWIRQALHYLIDRPLANHPLGRPYPPPREPGASLRAGPHSAGTRPASTRTAARAGTIGWTPTPPVTQ
jgi:hypothetical protein